ncbi:MAG: SDR family oxidoreductase [Alphaproteobacteria bacterium]|jgi:hypothetical protein|nr:SDR family oxidoreductase [Alphaproteobacteria bacterium]
MGSRLENKTALVVGAGSVGNGWSNGRATAVLFAREGARVVAADINLDSAAETVSLIEKEGGVAVAHKVDATDTTEVAAMISRCIEHYGRLDILHNNVGGSIPGGPVEIAEADWNANLSFNLTTAFLTCKHALPVMVAQGGGAIVNVSSVAGLTFVDRPLASYQAAKAGLIQFSRAVAVEYADKGIRCNCVVPGMMDTPLVRHRLIDKDDPAKADAILARRHARTAVWIIPAIVAFMCASITNTPRSPTTKPQLSTPGLVDMSANTPGPSSLVTSSAPAG